MRFLGCNFIHTLTFTSSPSSTHHHAGYCNHHSHTRRYVKIMPHGGAVFLLVIALSSRPLDRRGIQRPFPRNTRRDEEEARRFSSASSSTSSLRERSALPLLLEVRAELNHLVGRELALEHDHLVMSRGHASNSDPHGRGAGCHPRVLNDHPRVLNHVGATVVVCWNRDASVRSARRIVRATARARSHARRGTSPSHPSNPRFMKRDDSSTTAGTGNRRRPRARRA